MGKRLSHLVLAVAIALPAGLGALAATPALAMGVCVPLTGQAMPQQGGGTLTTLDAPATAPAVPVSYSCRWTLTGAVAGTPAAIAVTVSVTNTTAPTTISWSVNSCIGGNATPVSGSFTVPAGTPAFAYSAGRTWNDAGESQCTTTLAVTAGSAQSISANLTYVT